MNKFLPAALLSLFVFGAPALADTGLEISKSCNVSKDVERDALDLSDVLELAMCNNPATRQAWLNTQVGRTAYNMSLGGYLPQVNANAGYTKSWTEEHVEGLNPTTRGQAASAGLSLSWLLYDFGRREASVERTFQNMNSANFSYSNTLQQVAYDVISAYYNVLSSAEALAAVKANEEATLKSFELASKKFDLGMASKADKLQTETTYLQAQLDTTRQEQALKTARANLAKLMGLPPNMDIRLTAVAKDTTDELVSKSMDDIIAVAMKKRPDLRAKDAEVRASYAGVRSASAAFFPTLSATAAKDWRDRSAHDWSTGLDDSGYSVGVKVSMPIFTGFENTYSLRNAKYQHAAKKEELQLLEQNIELSVVNAYNDYRTSLKSLDLARKMYESAQENEKVAMGSYQAGKGDIIQLMAAQSKLLLANKEVIAAQYGVYTYKIALLKAAGSLTLGSLGLAQNG